MRGNKKGVGLPDHCRAGSANIPREESEKERTTELESTSESAAKACWSGKLAGM